MAPEEPVLAEPDAQEGPVESPLAPGWPGIPARWTSSAKSSVGTALNNNSRVWFTLSHGILNEVYYPRVDQACVRDFGLIVTDGKEFFSEEKRHTTSEFSYLGEGVPACRMVNTCVNGRYRIEKEVITDPERDVLLQKVTLTALQGSLSDYHLYALLAPHIGNRGMDNTAWLESYKGVPMLVAEREGNALALACSVPWIKRSAGFVGFSDGWQDLAHHYQMQWAYQRAERGNVALTGEVDLIASGGSFITALGFGRTPAEACLRALSSLQENYQHILANFIQEWQAWQKRIVDLPDGKLEKAGVYRTSAMVLRAHEAKNIPGGLIASLSIPWGASVGDNNLGGYHLVWPRDLVETAGGLLAAGARVEAHHILHYLQSTQEADGHWPQNMWLDGTPYWDGIQLDESAFPILLVDIARRERAFEQDDVARLWPMVRRAAGFIVRNGPVTQQDRWEEDPGYSPFTLAVEIAALLAASDQAVNNQEPDLAVYLRETADAWNDAIESWTYVTGTPLANQVGVEGYYVRIAPPEVAEAASPLDGFVPIKNRPPGQSQEPAGHIVSPDALALVRFGLRDPHDRRILNTLKVIDSLLKVETPFGPTWYRYNDDGYGEHEDGQPFDGTGIGQGWPLLTGERAHYELAAGNIEEANRLRLALERFSNEGDMLPEQVWTREDIPALELFRGRPSGSAMPLVWAHAEYIKLRRSLHDGRIFDMPHVTAQRYLEEKKAAHLAVWRSNQKCRKVQAGRFLRVELTEPGSVRWSQDGWVTSQETNLESTGLGTYKADLPIAHLPAGKTVAFAFRTQDENAAGEYTCQVVSNKG